MKQLEKWYFDCRYTTVPVRRMQYHPMGMCYFVHLLPSVSVMRDTRNTIVKVEFWKWQIILHWHKVITNYYE